MYNVKKILENWKENN